MPLDEKEMYEISSRAVRLLNIRELCMEVTADYKKLFAEVQRLQRENDLLKLANTELTQTVLILTKEYPG